MATFIAHGLVGAAALETVIVLGDYVVPRCLKTNKTSRIILAVLGFIEGTLPDTVDWIAATFFGVERWVLYGWWHNSMPWTLDVILFPAYLHVQMDKWFHRVPGANWWYEYPYLASVEIVMWVVPLFLLYIYIWRIKD